MLRTHLLQRGYVINNSTEFLNFDDVFFIAPLDPEIVVPGSVVEHEKYSKQTKAASSVGHKSGKLWSKSKLFRWIPNSYPQREQNPQKINDQFTTDSHCWYTCTLHSFAFRCLSFLSVNTRKEQVVVDTQQTNRLLQTAQNFDSWFGFCQVRNWQALQPPSRVNNRWYKRKDLRGVSHLFLDDAVLGTLELSAWFHIRKLTNKGCHCFPNSDRHHTRSFSSLVRHT